MGASIAAPGSLDATFGTGGTVRSRAAPSSDYAAAVAIQADGRIVVAGASQAGASSDADFALARYNFDGTLDTTFGVGGRVITPIGNGDDWALAVAIQADGKIVAAGYSFNGSNNDFALARYNTDGSLDLCRWRRSTALRE